MQMRLLLPKIVFIAFLCAYLIGPISFADAACKGSKCNRRRKSEEKQTNNEGDSMTHMAELEPKPQKSSEEESEEKDSKKESADKGAEEVALAKTNRMRRHHELKRTPELGETGGNYRQSAAEHHRDRDNHYEGHHGHRHHNRRHISEDCHSSEGEEAHKKHAQKAEPDSTTPVRKRRGESSQMDLHMFDNVARRYNRRHVSEDCHSSEGEEAHKKHANKAANRRRRSEHVQMPRFGDPEQQELAIPDEAEDRTLSRKPRAYDHDKKWGKRDDQLEGAENLVASHSHSAHNRRTVKRDSEAMPNLKYPNEDEIAAVARHRMNLGGANAEHIRYPGGRRVGPFPERRGRVGPFPEDYPPFVDEHTDAMVERAMAEMEKELKHHHHKNRLN